jgi:predicted phosphodiesterase
MSRATTRRPFRRGLITPDKHFPRESITAMTAVLRFAAERHWDFYVDLGDMLDFGCISPHSANSPGLTEGERLKSDIDYGNAMLDLTVKAVRNRNPACEIYYVQGNHEYWLEKLVQRMPVFEGLLDLPTMLRLDERRITWIPSHSLGHKLEVGTDRMILHGQYHNKYHASKHADAHAKSVIYGHTHSFDSYDREQWGFGRTIHAQSLGCLCKFEQFYRHGMPDKWSHGFGVLDVLEDGRTFLHTVRIRDGVFTSPEGSLYEGSKSYEKL